MKTRITELLGIEYPIIQGGMAWVAESHLAAAVSAAGGLGLIGGSIAMGLKEFEDFKRVGVDVSQPTLRYALEQGIVDQVCEDPREALAQADVGNQETQALVDAVLTAVVLEHGEQAMDPDAPETALGWRLAVPFFSVKEMREKYEIHARRGEDGKYILGVMERRSDL